MYMRTSNWSGAGAVWSLTSASAQSLQIDANSPLSFAWEYVQTNGLSIKFERLKSQVKLPCDWRFRVVFIPISFRWNFFHSDCWFGWVMRVSVSPFMLVMVVLSENRNSSGLLTDTPKCGLPEWTNSIPNHGVLFIFLKSNPIYSNFHV